MLRAEGEDDERLRPGAESEPEPCNTAPLRWGTELLLHQVTCPVGFKGFQSGSVFS